MTSLSSNILFNSSTGSDTAASGVGPSTAVTGTGGSTNNTTTVDLSADTPDLSGVSAGDLLYLATSSGRRFSVIASVDDGADTVTCDDTFTLTEGSLSWAIGGKRATFDDTNSRRIFANDPASGWTIETETNQAITSQITLATNLVILGSTGAEEISGNYNGTLFQSANIGAMKDLVLTFSLGTGTSRRGFAANGTTFYTFENVHFKSCEDGFVRTGNTPNATFFKCVFSDCDQGIAASTSTLYIYDCIFADNVYGCSASLSPRETFANNCVFYNNTHGIRISNESYVTRCVFYANTVGTYLVNALADLISVSGNISWGNGHAYRAVSGTSYRLFASNAYGGSTTADFDGNETYWAYGINIDNIDGSTLTADPFVDGANGDFELNATAGGGAVLKNAGYTLHEGTNIYPYNSWADASAGGGFRRITLNGGMNG